MMDGEMNSTCGGGSQASAFANFCAQASDRVEGHTNSAILSSLAILSI
jgi:hypothetical protein